MGADMSLATLPAFAITNQRLAKLLKTIEAIDVKTTSKENLENWELEDLEAEKSGAFDGARTLRDMIGGREVETLTVSGADYAIWVTGGMSWGDPPTEAYEPFCHMNAFEEVWKLMESWAKEDLAKVGLGKIYDRVNKRFGKKEVK